MEALVETNYSIDTFYFLVMGALVMFMAPGFAMLEAGLVRAKNTAEILTKNVALFAIACIMYLFFGYALMYGDVAEGAWIPGFGMGIGEENTAADVLASGGTPTTLHVRITSSRSSSWRRPCPLCPAQWQSA